MREKKIGVSRLHLLDGTVLHNRLLVWRNGRFVGHYPLTEEQAFTRWIGGDFYLSSIAEASFSDETSSDSEE